MFRWAAGRSFGNPFLINMPYLGVCACLGFVARGGVRGRVIKGWGKLHAVALIKQKPWGTHLVPFEVPPSLLHWSFRKSCCINKRDAKRVTNRSCPGY